MTDFNELDDEQYIALGRLTAKFSDLEHAVKRMIGFILDSDPSVGAIVTARASFNQLLSVFDALAIYKIADPRTEVEEDDRAKLRGLLNDAVKTARAAAEKRNQLIHSVWFPEHYVDGEQLRKHAKRVKVSLTRDKGLSYQPETLKTKDLNEIVATVEKANLAVSRMWPAMGSRGLLQGVLIDKDQFAL